MFFGKFLLDKKLITKANLIKAMAKQFESQPSFLGELQKQNILNESEIVAALTESLVKSISLQETLISRKLLTHEKIADIQWIISKSGLGLGSALIEIEAIDPEKLNEALKEYIQYKKDTPVEKQKEEVDKVDDSPAEVEISNAALESLKELGITDESEISELESKSSSENEPTEKSVDEPAISSAALESLKELGISDENEIAKLEGNISSSVEESSQQEVDSGEVAVSSAALESLKELGIGDEAELEELEAKTKSGLEFEGLSDKFIDLLDEKSYEQMQSNTKKLSKGLDESVVADLYDGVAKLSSVASEEGLQYSQKLLTCYKKVLEYVMSKNTNFINFNFLNFAASTKEALNLIWDLKEEIKKSGGEGGLLNNADWKNRYLANLKSGISLITLKE